MVMAHRPMHAEGHVTDRTGWLRAAVLGANDGLLSTASLVLGVAAAGATQGAMLTAGIAGLTAGALSMASGEYVSVSSQRDAERADLAREAQELVDDPEGELDELAKIYEARGISTALAREIAVELSKGDQLAVHARDELGINQDALARPVLAAVASAISFAVGAIIPIVAALPAYGNAVRVWAIVITTIIGLVLLGATGARLGKAPMFRAAARVGMWGVAAMAVTSAIGAVVGSVV